jgi:hypothetical protein
VYSSHIFAKHEKEDMLHMRDVVLAKIAALKKVCLSVFGGVLRIQWLLLGR